MRAQLSLVFALMISLSPAVTADNFAYVSCEAYRQDETPGKVHPGVRLFSKIYNQTVLKTSEAMLATVPDFQAYLKSAFPEYKYPHRAIDTCWLSETNGPRGDVPTVAQLEAIRQRTLEDFKRRGKTVEQTEWAP